MKHSTWLQNRTPACAINGKTPYEMKHKKKPHLAGIQEFSAAAYVKDLKAVNLMLVLKLDDLLAMIQNPRGTTSIGHTNNQYYSW